MFCSLHVLQQLNRQKNNHKECSNKKHIKHLQTFCINATTHQKIIKIIKVSMHIKQATNTLETFGATHTHTHTHTHIKS